ncbi:LysR family transcriptional regulator [Derxia gummosa]|uniref:LysR family transcriptional regulator n=1 Tax=Derxia gummosa DSM 723 TaxID=1121388 RepID=A0A8B6X985_9BURK|nr:LysR family transcriptional regulator [Derxia gummosa]
MSANPVRLPEGGPRRHRALPDLHALEAFVTVCEAGSMALAAQRLGVSQSAVSQLVKALEIECGTQLFDREVRPARPTHAGRSLLDRASALLEQARALVEQVRASARQDHAQIRLGCVDSFAATVGPALIRALAGSARQLQLWSGLTPGLSAQLQARELDLVICTDTRLDDTRISQRLLFSEAFVAVFPRGVLPGTDVDAADGPGAGNADAAPAGQGAAPSSQGAAPVALRDLTRLAGDLPLIRYTARSVMGQQVDRFLRHARIDAPRRFEFDATDPMLSLVSAGLGWAISTPLCLWQSRQYLDSVSVVPLPPTRLGQRDFFLLARDAEWAGLDEEVMRVARSVLSRETAPAIRRAMPALPADAITWPEAG